MAPWTDEKEKQFLALLLVKAGDLNVTKATTEIVPLMRNEFSAETLRQKYYKLKREADAVVSAHAAASGTAPGTPPVATAAITPSTKRAKSTPTTKGAGTGRGKRKQADSIAADDDDDDNNGTSVKKPRKRATKKQAKQEDPIEAEDGNGDEDQVTDMKAGNTDNDDGGDIKGKGKAQAIDIVDDETVGQQDDVTITGVDDEEDFD